MSENGYVLGIDTSCYTTSAAVALNGTILSFGRKLLPVEKGERGLRQSEAVFAHLKQLPDVVGQVMDALDVPPGAVCVSASPRDGEDSYMPVFRTGLSFARVLSSCLKIPLFTTTHQRGHIRAAQIDSGLEDETFLAVHLSGGTTDVLWVRADGQIELMGSSLDLHAGQLVDRTGVRLGLPFPSGKELEKLALSGRSAQRVPVSMEGGSCHLSGCETRLQQLMAQGLSPEDTAAEVYSVLSRTVLRMLCAAAEKSGIRRCLIAGGVASSGLLRTLLDERNRKKGLGLELYYGRPEYSSDNAAGVALIGEELWRPDRPGSRGGAPKEDRRETGSDAY